eukprot:m.93760 g.93760  ORF g.93760 m.93760 type:complete len:50 (+) comp13009_c0_seq2:550-699(+)
MPRNNFRDTDRYKWTVVVLDGHLSRLQSLNSKPNRSTSFSYNLQPCASK